MRTCVCVCVCVCIYMLCIHITVYTCYGYISPCIRAMDTEHSIYAMKRRMHAVHRKIP